MASIAAAARMRRPGVRLRRPGVRVHAALPSAAVICCRSSARSSDAPCRALSTGPADAPLEPDLLIANAPGLRIVDLNRPRVLNSLSGSMVRTLLPLVQDWQQPGGDVHLVVLRGSEPRAFCAGGDIRFLLDCALIGEGPPLAAAHAFFFDEYTLNHALGTSRVPIVSLLEGIVMGGGVGLSVHGHVRVATESTLFAMPETGIGFFPDVGATYALPRLRSAALGAYLGLTGARLSGRDVVTAGARWRCKCRDLFFAMPVTMRVLAARLRCRHCDALCDALAAANGRGRALPVRRECNLNRPRCQRTRFAQCDSVGGWARRCPGGRIWRRIARTTFLS